MKIYNYKNQRNELWRKALTYGFRLKYISILELFFVELFYDLGIKIRNLIRNKTKRNLSSIYNKHLQRIKKSVKSNKRVRVAIIVNDFRLSSAAFVLKALKNLDIFDVTICITHPHSSFYSHKEYGEIYDQQAIDSFLENGVDKKSIKILYKMVDITYKEKPINYKEFDIIAYQTIWETNNYNPLDAARYCLTIYFPYCFSMFNTDISYLDYFHAFLWKYFSESIFHVDEFRQYYNASNVVGLGNPKLDNYSLTIKKNITKPTIIYAPHWTVGQNTYKDITKTSTFEWSARFLLNFAKDNKDKYDFIFRPHPRLKKELNRIMKNEEVLDFFNEWQNIAKFSSGADYYQDFVDSSLMITDSISFLGEYLPSGNPLIRLTIENEEANFNTLGKKIVSSYYIVQNEDDLKATLNKLLVEKNDDMKNKRLEALSYLNISDDSLISQKIANYLKEQFSRTKHE